MDGESRYSQLVGGGVYIFFFIWTETILKSLYNMYYVCKRVALNIICIIPATFIIQFPEGGKISFHFEMPLHLIDTNDLVFLKHHKI